MTLKTKNLLLTETSRSLLDKLTYYMDQVDEEHAYMLLGLKKTVKRIHDTLNVEYINGQGFENITWFRHYPFH